ncbi:MULTISPECIES: hypothetical protein [unclassified Anaerobiospirillum]|uniref:hypothetical protein n=1 Tax=unclassified Anaerobiospirillum TaxID=2647410 RepID=UPI001FF235D3|nr:MULTISPECIES: hypothetical protein [unclassified Anaerobiospirillum]MCK0534551.1 hypothetical protein [Anaerobiospirillum sp. NML120511]MCK0540634.1 hypothetical protein [Anaerobiospirillum sp. NML02-A-032]
MAKQGLVRIPFYPQLNCLRDLGSDIPLVMSALLFWMSRAKEPTFCPKRHNHQIALHLGMDHQSFASAFEKLNAQGIFCRHEKFIEPKEKTEDSRVKVEELYDLNFSACQQLLAQHGFDISLKLLINAADDSFDCYDVIEEKFLPTIQSLHGFLSGADYERAALDMAALTVYINEFHEDFAFKAIAPGWKLLLAIPMGAQWQDYARELSVRFMRAGERAIDFSFTDGNFFVPDHAEIKSKIHMVKHYGNKHEARIMAAAMMMALACRFPEHLTFTSELSVSQLIPALALVKEAFTDLDLSPALREDYYTSRRLSVQQQASEEQLFATWLASRTGA